MGARKGDREQGLADRCAANQCRMYPFYENACFGSHADRFFPGGVGFLIPRKTHGSHEALAVATPAIFTRRGDLKKVMGHSLENPLPWRRWSRLRLRGWVRYDRINPPLHPSGGGE